MCSRSAFVTDGKRGYFFVGRMQCVAFPGLRGIGGTSNGSQPTTYNQVAFSARCPQWYCSISIDQPPNSSGNSPGRGNRWSIHSELSAGCSSTPPNLRTFATAKIANSFSPGRGFANWRSLPPRPARRVCYHTATTRPEPCVPLNVPDVTPWQRLVVAVSACKKYGNCHHVSSTEWHNPSINTVSV